VTGKANLALIDENEDYCLALEYAEPDAHGIGKLSLNLQVGSGGDRFMELVRGFSTKEVEYELYPTAPILKKHALTIYLHDGHYVSNARLATVSSWPIKTFTSMVVYEKTRPLKPRPPPSPYPHYLLTRSLSCSDRIMSALLPRPKSRKKPGLA
jgi:hypothetical protein